MARLRERHQDFPNPRVFLVKTIDSPDIGSLWVLHRSIAFRRGEDTPDWPLAGPAEEFLESGELFVVIRFYAPHWVLVLSRNSGVGWITVGEWHPNWVHHFAHEISL